MPLFSRMILKEGDIWGISIWHERTVGRLGCLKQDVLARAILA